MTVPQECWIYINAISWVSAIKAFGAFILIYILSVIGMWFTAKYIKFPKTKPKRGVRR